MISATLLAAALTATPPATPIAPATALAPAGTAAQAGLVLSVETARIQADADTAQDVLDIRLDAASRSAFARLTADNVGKTLALLVDGHMLMRPTIQSPIEGGEVRITGGVGPQALSSQSLRAIAARLNEGGRIEVKIVEPDGATGDLPVETETT